MKNNNFIVEIVTSLVLIILAVFLLNPFHAWMPAMGVKMIAGALLVIFTIFAGLLWKEKAKDERELLHKMIAGRIAFLVGTALIVIAIIYQNFTTQIDPWLVIILAGMILSKIAGLIYGQLKH